MYSLVPICVPPPQLRKEGARKLGTTPHWRTTLTTEPPMTAKELLLLPSRPLNTTASSLFPFPPASFAAAEPLHSPSTVTPPAAHRQPSLAQRLSTSRRIPRPAGLPARGSRRRCRRGGRRSSPLPLLLPAPRVLPHQRQHFVVRGICSHASVARVLGL